MQPVLEVQNLSVEYPDGFALHPVSFSIAAGETLAVIGESGSGKTTLVRAVADLFSCRWARVSGKALLEGENLVSAGKSACASCGCAVFRSFFQKAPRC